MAVTSAEIIEKFATGSAIKNSDQFLMGVIGSGNNLVLQKIGAEIVKAYLWGNLTTSNITGTLNGSVVSLDVILADIRRILSTKADDESFGNLVEIVNHGGLLEFDGFVDDIRILSMSAMIHPDGIYYDRVKKTFCARFGTSYVNNYTDPDTGTGITDYQQTVYTSAAIQVDLWPLRVYKCRSNGMSYMWSNDNLVPVNEEITETHTSDDLEITISPDVLHLWPAVSALGLTMSDNDEQHKHRLQFIAEDGFSLEINPSVRWPNGEEPTWRNGWTYRVTINQNLATVTGWPPE